MKKIEYRKVMDKVGGGIIKFRVPIIILTAVLLVLSVFGIMKTTINSDIMSYLPEGTDTYDGSQFLHSNFNIQSNSVYAVKGEDMTDNEIKIAVDNIKEIDHVTNVLWKKSMGQEINFLKGGSDATKEIEKLFVKDGNYILMITMDVGASTDEAGEALSQINKELDSIEAEYVSGGTAPTSRKVYDDAISELPIYMIVAVVLVLLVLFLVSANYLEPLVFMLTMGVSIAINMGTNFFFPEVSIITFCAASILQLALAMDYSIFLTQIYSEERAKGLPMKGAMVSAIGTTLNTVFASALTTMGGFAAFFVMSFTLGADLGGVLLKGIGLAMLTVIILQPCLLILLSKPMAKLNHKIILNFKFKAVAKFSVRHRIVIVVLFSMILIPAFIGQYFLPLSYLNFLPKTEGDLALVTAVQDMSNQLFLATPASETSIEKNVAFVDTLRAIPGVSGVSGYYAFLPAEAIGDDGYFIAKYDSLQETVREKGTIYEMGKEKGYITEDGYTLYMIAMTKDYNIESQEAEDMLQAVRSAARAAFAEEWEAGKPCYITGVLQAVSEFREITPRDFRWITIISVLVIFAVLLISFRNFIYPFLLVLLIELGTWINFSLSTIFGQSLNFLAYIVVGAIQLGATVDYAILVTNKYRAIRKEGKDPLMAAYESGTSCTMSILTSASILVLACASVTIISSNAVIKEVTMMCMRGAVISTMLVLFVLPSLLACTSRLRTRALAAGGMHNLTKGFLRMVNGELHESSLVAKARLRIKKRSLLNPGERVEDLDTRGLVIIQPKKGYRFNSDSVILANLVDAKEGEKVYDLGCGSGIIGLLVAAKRKAQVVGVEIQPTLASMAKRSVLANRYDERMQVIEGDVRETASLFPQGDADVVVINPPYFKEGSGEVSHDEMKAIARHEITLTLEEELAAADHLLKVGGEAYFVFPASREKEFNEQAAAKGFALVEKTYLTASEQKPAESFIAKLRKGVQGAETVERTLVTKDEAGRMSEAVLSLYRS